MKNMSSKKVKMSKNSTFQKLQAKFYTMTNFKKNFFYKKSPKNPHFKSFQKFSKVYESFIL